MSFIGGPLPNIGSSSSSSYGGAGNSSQEGIFEEEKKKDSNRPARMQKFAEAVDKSLKYKQQKEVDAEVDKENGDDNEMVGPKGFKVGTDSTVVTGYTDPGFTLAGQQGRSLLGPVGAALSVFPKTAMIGRAVGAVGSLTGL